MKKRRLFLIFGAFLAGFLYFYADSQYSQHLSTQQAEDGSGAIRRQTVGENDPLTVAYETGKSNVQVQGSGVVSHVLRDDTKGSRHQKFILRLSSGQTILIAHNIDLSPRIESLKKGDSVSFFGEYEWSEKGGVVHWTHKDPRGRHIDGWLKHQDVLYQ